MANSTLTGQQLETLLPRRYQEEVFTRAQKGLSNWHILFHFPPIKTMVRKHHRGSQHWFRKDPNQSPSHQMDNSQGTVQGKGYHFLGPESHACGTTEPLH